MCAFAANRAVQRNSSTNRAVRINLEACFPELSINDREALFLRSTELHLQAAMRSPRQWWGSTENINQHARIHQREILDDAIASQRAVVLLVTHSAGLDAGLLALSPHYDMLGIYNPLGNSVLDWLVLRSRRRFGADPMTRGSGFRPIVRGMKEGKIMCYLGDEDLGIESGVFAPFFGNQKATLTMLPRLVKATNAICIPMIAHHNPDDDGVDVHFLPPLDNFPADDAVSDASEMNEAIASTIRLQPEQFTWKLRVFKTCPQGKGTRYGQIERGEITVNEL